MNNVTRPARVPTRALRVGIVGAGMVGSIHARSARIAGAELVAISAGSPATAAAAAERLGVPRPFADARALVEDPAIDVVHICTPNDLHYELAGAALAAGKHVVCEKPLAIRTEQAEALTRQALAAGAIAAVPFVYRFFPMVREARALVEEGALGPTSLLSGAYLQDWLLSPESSNWRVDAARGGPSRAFADIGSHLCDLLEFVTAERISSLSAQMRTVHPERPRSAATAHSFATAAVPAGDDGVAVETEDLAAVSFRTAAGAVGQLVVSQVSPGHKNHLSLEVTGSLARLAFDGNAPDQLTLAGAGPLQVLERDPARLHPSARPYATLPAGHPQGYHDCFDSFVADTYASIAGGEPVSGLPTFADGVRAGVLTDAALNSAAAGGAWVEVDEAAEEGSRE